MKPVEHQEARHQFIPPKFFDEAGSSVAGLANQLQHPLQPGAVQIHHQANQFLHGAPQVRLGVASISPSNASIDSSRCWNSGCAGM